MRITVDISTFRDLITGALVAAGTDTTLPRLMCIGVEHDGAVLTCTSTDRYRLMSGAVEAPSDDGAGLVKPFMLARGDAESLLKALPSTAVKMRNGLVFVDIQNPNEYSSTMIVTCGSMVMSFDGQQGTFPAWRRLIPNEATVLDAGFHAISFNPKFLASFDKVPHVRNSPITLIMTSADAPAQIVIKHDHIEWSGVLMPVRDPSRVAVRWVGGAVDKNVA